MSENLGSSKKSNRLTLLVLCLLPVLIVLFVPYYVKRGAKEEVAEGTTPSGVRPIPDPAVTTDKRSTGTDFREEARESGIDFHMTFLTLEQGEVFKLNLYDHGSGVAVGDYNGDGYDDLYFLNQFGENALFKNKGNGTFENTTKEAGGLGLGDRISVGSTFSDYDNDGDQDLFVTTTRAGNVLFENQGNGRFVDVTKKAGLVHIGHSSTASFFDYDNDGDLDLYLTNTAEWTGGMFDQAYKYFPGQDGGLWALVTSPIELNILYRNNGDGTFTDVTSAAGVMGKGWGGDIAVADYDEDGDIDLFVTNMFGVSLLYRNEGNGKFSDQTKQALGRTSFGPIGSKFFDFNNDGLLDLVMVDMHSDMWMSYNDFDYSTIKDWEKYPFILGPLPIADTYHYLEKEKEFADKLQVNYERAIFGNTLMKNLGNGKFQEVSDQAKMETFWPWGVATGDFDQDGFEDVFIPSGMGYPFPYWMNYLMMNNGNGTFSNRSREHGIEPPRLGIYLEKKIARKVAPRSSRCAATSDFDHDGRLDLIVNNFNDYPYYFRNNFPSKNYVAFKLSGTKSNRDAIGARVKIYFDNEVMVRQVHAAGGYLSQSSKTLHFGLGERSKIKGARIFWPSGIRQTIPSPSINQLHYVTEPKE